MYQVRRMYRLGYYYSLWKHKHYEEEPPPPADCGGNAWWVPSFEQNHATTTTTTTSSSTTKKSNQSSKSCNTPTCSTTNENSVRSKWVHSSICCTTTTIQTLFYHSQQTIDVLPCDWDHNMAFSSSTSITKWHSFIVYEYTTFTHTSTLPSDITGYSIILSLKFDEVKCTR